MISVKFSSMKTWNLHLNPLWVKCLEVCFSDYSLSKSRIFVWRALKECVVCCGGMTVRWFIMAFEIYLPQKNVCKGNYLQNSWLFMNDFAMLTQIAVRYLWHQCDMAFWGLLALHFVTVLVAIQPLWRRLLEGNEPVADRSGLRLVLQEVTGFEMLRKRLYSIPQARSPGQHPALQD